jgi:hypothetical protein
MALPISVAEIGDGAFAGCKNLSRLGMAPESKLTGIGAAAFSNCCMEPIETSGSVKMIGDDAFSGCSSLKFLKFHLNVSVVRECTESLRGCPIEKVSFCESVTIIGPNPLCFFPALSEIVFDSPMERICVNEFAECPFRSFGFRFR